MIIIISLIIHLFMRFNFSPLPLRIHTMWCIILARSFTPISLLCAAWENFPQGTYPHYTSSGDLRFYLSAPASRCHNVMVGSLPFSECWKLDRNAGSTYLEEPDTFLRWPTYFWRARIQIMVLVYKLP